VQAKPTRSPDRASQAGALPYEICAYSMDHPGIVQRLSAFLAQRQINIRALDTRLTYAPVTGLPLFSIHALVDLPAKQNVAEVRRGLEQLCAQENIDVELRPAGK
jgi:glycine cleavage system regulatory protein